MIKTSIVVPVHNTAEYLVDCFDSIFKQTQKEIEVIAIDDGSTDNSLYILEQIKKTHPQMRVFSQKNEGLGSSRNKGLELATGEFTYFLDSDDCLVDTALEKCYQYAKDNHLDIVMFDAETFGDIRCKTGYYNRAEIIEDQETVLSGMEFANKYWTKTFVPSACLIYTSTQFLKQHNLKFLPKIYYEDNEFYCKMLPLAERVMYIPKLFYKRRYRESSITTSLFDLRHAKDYLTMLQSIGVHQYSDELMPVVHRVQINMLESLYVKCLASNLLSDMSILQKLYDTALSICGHMIESVDQFPDIDLLSRISSNAPENMISKETKRKIEKRKREIAEGIFSRIPIGKEKYFVGIYGTGKNTERFLREYENYAGEIKATLIFIESNIVSQTRQYKGIDIFNIDDVKDMELDCIIIASSMYEFQMSRRVKERYGNRFKIIRLMTDLQF